jgi:putative glutamine amidotransferase
MPKKPPLVAVTADLRLVGSLRSHLTPSTYIDALVHASGVMPMIVPALGSRLDIPALISMIDGLLVTGSPSNVHPNHYGEEETEQHGPFDLDRDETTLPLIRAAIEAGVPVLAICRGHQELNVAFGGSLETEIQTIAGRDDHRSPGTHDADQNYAIRQPVSLVEGGVVASIMGVQEVQVNSLHRQAICRLAPCLCVEAVAPDGTIEAVSVAGARAFALGIQWHPEYWASEDGPSRALFRAFADAVSAHAALKA